MSPSTFLLVLGEGQAIYWVLSQSRTAFVDRRAASAMGLVVGDSLLVYTTRGAWHNPTRDRGRIIAEAEVLSPPSRLADPLEVAGRAFTVGVDLDLQQVAPFGEGVILSELVPQLDMFPDKRSWSARLRTSLLPVPDHDGAVIRERLHPQLQDLSSALTSYRQAARLSD